MELILEIGTNNCGCGIDKQEFVWGVRLWFMAVHVVKVKYKLQEQIWEKGA